MAYYVYSFFFNFDSSKLLKDFDLEKKFSIIKMYIKKPVKQLHWLERTVMIIIILIIPKRVLDLSEAHLDLSLGMPSYSKASNLSFTDIHYASLQ